MIDLTILMEPVGKGRPRVTRRGNKVVTYTPNATAHAESIIRAQAMTLEEHYTKETPLLLTATFFRAPPQKLPKGRSKPITRPDWDNYGKLLSDALEGFAYDNDSQITTAIIKKRYGYPPRIELQIIEDMNT